MLDATYKTTKYDLPLFFICVQTNIGFAICGTFICANESKDCIAEALGIMKEWNPDWHLSHFFTDFDEREITAVEEIFPGNLFLLEHKYLNGPCKRWTSRKGSQILNEN